MSINASVCKFGHVTVILSCMDQWSQVCLHRVFFVPPKQVPCRVRPENQQMQANLNDYYARLRGCWQSHFDKPLTMGQADIM